MKVFDCYKRICERKIKRNLKLCGDCVKIEYPFYFGGEKNVSIGKNTTILAGGRIAVVNDISGLNSTLSIGDGCYFSYRVCILAGENIVIGNNVLFASDVSVVSYNHGTNPENEIPYMSQELKAAPITIGNNCWIGEKVFITAGVNIGNGCVVGANSVVTHDIPDYCIAVGSPARVIKTWNFSVHCWENVE